MQRSSPLVSSRAILVAEDGEMGRETGMIRLVRNDRVPLLLCMPCLV